MKAFFPIVLMTLALAACTTYNNPPPMHSSTTTSYSRPMMNATPVATTSVHTTTAD